MWQRKFRRLLLIAKGIIGVMQKRRLIRFLLLPIGIIGILVIMLVVPLNYTPDTSVPFPYIPPPEGDEGYYMAATVDEITTSFLSVHDIVLGFDAELFKGQSFIIKNVQLPSGFLMTEKIETYADGKVMSSETETYIMVSLVRFIPQDLSEWQKLKAGDVIDIIGVIAGMSTAGETVVVFRNCQFFPAGMAPMPLPGGTTFVAGGY